MGLLGGAGGRHRAAVLLALLGIPTSARAWPHDIVRAMMRDARRLVPESLSHLIGDRETLILEDTEHFPEALRRALARDLYAGKLTVETLAALDARGGEAVALLRHQQVTLGIVALGATLRIPADLSDPVLVAGAETYPPGVIAEYYAFLEANLGKIPVVLDEPSALKLTKADLPAYWEGILARSQTQSPVIRTELFQRGRTVDHRTLDYRSPVFGVASLSYSRAVTAIAGTWLALWRQAHGDVTRMRPPRDLEPQPPSSPEPHEASR
jgi:hypothetical protein